MTRSKITTCKHVGCSVEVESWQDFCRGHYGQVPGNIRKAMHEARERKDTIAYHKAVGEALKYFALKAERKPVKRPETLMANLFGGGDA